MKKITIKEYAEQVGKTKEAILYQIKKGKIKAEKNKNNIWFIFIEEEKKEQTKINNFQAQELENKIKLLEQEVELKNEIIETQKEVIQAEKRTSLVLGQSYQDLKQKQEIILIENNEVKKEIIEVKEKNLIYRFFRKFFI